MTGYEPTIAAQCAIDATDRALQPLRELANEWQIVIMAGCPIRSAVKKPFIGMFIFQPHQAVAVYRKRFVHSSEEPFFIASDDTCLVAVRGTSVAPAICADISNPDHAADAARKGANVYAAGVAETPEDRARADAKMSSHAKQHGMLAVLSNYASATGGFPTGGRSAAWDETGLLIAEAEAQGECIVIAQKTPAGWAGTVVKV